MFTPTATPANRPATSTPLDRPHAQRPPLSDYDTLDNAIADELPEGIIAKAKEALRKSDVIWRDI